MCITRTRITSSCLALKPKLQHVTRSAEFHGFAMSHLQQNLDAGALNTFSMLLMMALLQLHAGLQMNKAFKHDPCIQVDL